jgi:hypothetical protein
MVERYASTVQTALRLRHQGAERECLRATALNPDLAGAHDDYSYLARLYDEAVRSLKLAVGCGDRRPGELIRKRRSTQVSWHASGRYSRRQPLDLTAEHKDDIAIEQFDRRALQGGCELRLALPGDHDVAL